MPKIPLFELTFGTTIILGALLLLVHAFDGWSGSSSSTASSTPYTTTRNLNHNFTLDPLSQSGYWSPQTSQMNFCEEDYIITLYIAEFFNTISNVAYLYWAVVTLPCSSSPWKIWTWPLTHISLVTIGLTSALFHVALHHHGQLLDESSMYLLCASMDFPLWTTPKAVLAAPLRRMAFGVVLSVTCAAVIVFAFVRGGADFGVHSMLFCALLAGLWPRCMYLISKVQDDERKKGLTRTFRMGAGCFVVGFVIWCVDCFGCMELRGMRGWLVDLLPTGVGRVLGAVLEGHAWWHLLTAVGAGKFVALTHQLTSDRELLGEHKVMTDGAGVASVSGVNGAAMNGNGHIKKRGVNGAVMNGNGDIKKRAK